MGSSFFLHILFLSWLQTPEGSSLLILPFILGGDYTGLPIWTPKRWCQGDDGSGFQKSTLSSSPAYWQNCVRLLAYPGREMVLVISIPLSDASGNSLRCWHEACLIVLHASCLEFRVFLGITAVLERRI